MEPPAKRPRFLDPVDRNFARSFRDDQRHYEMVDSELEDEEEYDQIDDPDEELSLKRARLDYKLKTKFESIFEKYGRDFEGIGDEIDLATGDIVVNNGHLLDMQDERDVGGTSHARNRRMSSVESEDSLNSTDEDDLEDQEHDSGMGLNEDDMMEDDMILRGFVQPAWEQIVYERSRLEAVPSMERYADRTSEEQRMAVSHLGQQQSMVSSHSGRQKRFGPKGGPHVIDHISQGEIHNDNRIEPAWRVPGIVAAPGRRPILKSVLLQQPEIERSPSPETGCSVWAPPRGRGRRRKDGADTDAYFRGESVTSNRFYGTSVSTIPLNFQFNSNSVKPATSTRQIQRRQHFTAEEDQLMAEWVAKARDEGIQVWSDGLWKRFALKHPRHTWSSWKAHLRRLPPSTFGTGLEGPETSTSEVSTSIAPVQCRRSLTRDLGSSVADSTESLPNRSEYQRPTRVRRPTQRDPTIVSWAQADAAIQLLDPTLHAGLLEDARRDAPYYNFTVDHPIFPTSPHLLDAHLSRTKSHSPRLGTRYNKLPLEAENEVAESVASEAQTISEHGDISNEIKSNRPVDSELYLETLYSRPSNLDPRLFDSQGEFEAKPGLFAEPPNHSTVDGKQSDVDGSAVIIKAAESIRTTSNGPASPKTQTTTEADNSTRGEKRYPCPQKDSTGCNKTFSTAGTAARHSNLHICHKIQCPYPGCTKSFNASRPDNIKSHLQRHFSIDSESPAAQKTVTTKSETQLPASKPETENLLVEAQSGATGQTVEQDGGSGNVHRTERFVQNTVDPSYEFSDEEIGMDPVVMEPKASLSIPTRSSAVNGPHTDLRAQLVTPRTKTKPRKVVPQHVADGEDLDELSLGLDDFVFISSQPRSSAQSKFGSQTQVKREDTGFAGADQGGLTASTRKPFVTRELEDNDIDELWTDVPSLTPIGSSSRKRPRVETEQTGNKITPQVNHTGRGRRKSNLAKKDTKTGGLSPRLPASLSQQTPTRMQRVAADASKPLDNGETAKNHKRGRGVERAEIDDSAEEDSLSFQLSPPASHQTPLSSLATPNNSSPSQEGAAEDNETSTLVKTPGGTLRRCGEEWFVCGRSFCFKCGSTVTGS